MTPREEVLDVLYRFAQGIDTRDWALLESVFVPQFDYDYRSHRPGSFGTISATQWVAERRRRFDTMLATQHTMTNPRVDLDGDTASVRMYAEAWHVADIDGSREWCTIGGEYLDTLVRHDGAWRIRVLKLDRRWTVGNAAVLDLPTSRAS